jgi:hypothetical protein
LARRILAFPTGQYELSPLPPMLNELTDEIITVAVAAVEAVMAEQLARPSGKAQKRLLARVVADARGARAALDSTCAEKVGKRLERQAISVNSFVDEAVFNAAQARADAQAAADADLTARATIRRDLAAIDADEKKKLQKLRSEVYIGFWELEALLPGYVPPDPDGDVRAAALAAADEPWMPSITSREWKKIPPMPKDLALSLGVDGVEALWNYYLRFRSQAEVEIEHEW